MKRLAIGVDDFKEIIKEDFYYIDKTKFIEDILEDGSKVKLLNRPRRFGKTINMTTLKYFFDIKNAEENRKLFNNLYIEKSKYIEEQGKYPVIFLSLKEIKGKTWEEMLEEIKNYIKGLYNDFELSNIPLLVFSSFLIGFNKTLSPIGLIFIKIYLLIFVST